MRSSTLRFLLALSLLLNFSVLATAAYFFYKEPAYWISPFGTKIKKDRFLFEELSLKPEQVKELRARAMPFRAQIDQRRQAMFEKRKELIGLMRADTPDAKAIDTLLAEISRMQEDMQRMITSHMLEQKALLDKEQQKKFLDLIENAMTQGRQAECPPAEHN